MASLFESPPLFVDITATKPIKHALPILPLNITQKQSVTVTIFTPSGTHILTGTSKGYLNIISTTTLETIHSTRLCNGFIIFLRFAANGRDLLLNSSDRIVRTLPLPDLSDPEAIKIEVRSKFQDVVQRLSWNHVAFSGGPGDYVTASTYMNHDIYIWERAQNSLLKMLEGPKEELGVVEWHPTKPVVMACGLETGTIYIWSVPAAQKWSALAPDFAEVEENVEYLEREDEFDIHPAEEIHKRRLDQEDEDVDVLTIDPVKGGEVGDEEDTQKAEPRTSREERFRMPVVLDLSDSGESDDEMVAIGAGQFRRKSPGAGKVWAAQGEGEDGEEEKGARAAKTRRR